MRKIIRFGTGLIFLTITCGPLLFTSAVAASPAAGYFYPDSTISTNGIVRVVFFYDGKLYVGGNFTKVTDKNGTYNRTDLAAFNMASGRVTDFKANTNSGMVRAITAGNGKLFIGGSFTKINSVSRSKVAALDPVTGNVATGFRKTAGTIEGSVWALAVAENNLFFGGSFTSVDGIQRTNLAAMDIDSGALIQSFDPALAGSIDDSGKTDTGVFALKVHPTNPKIVFAAGNYLTIAGKTDRKFLTVFNSDGTLGPEIKNPVSNPIIALDASDSVLFAAVGGSGNKVVSFTIGTTPYTRFWSGIRAQGDVQAVAYGPPGYVYFGFHDGLLDTADSFRLAVLNAKTGGLYDAYPPMNSFFGVRALDMIENCLAVGGEFTRMNGRPQRYLAVFRTFPFTASGPLGPAIPVLSSPGNGEIGAPSDLALSWKYASRAETYELQVALDPQFSNCVVNEKGIKEIYGWCAGLTTATAHWWRVRASGAVGASDWSATWRFCTAPGAGDVPVIAYPVDGAAAQPLAFDLCWRPSPSALSYGLQIWEEENSSTSILDINGIIDTGFYVAGLVNLRRYYWQVNALTVGGTSDWALAGFQTNLAAPKSPRCVSPGNNASKIVHQTTLCWDRVGDAVSYRVQVSADRSFQNVLYDALGLTDTAAAVTGLADDTRYFWRVNAANEGGGAWSLIMQFNTVFPFPSAPRPLFPAAGHVAKSDSVFLIWSKSAPHVMHYWVEIARDSTMRGASIDSTALDTALFRQRLVDKKEYWWRVRAYNETGWSAFSEQRLFKTAFPAVTAKRFSLDKFAFYGNRGSVSYSVAEPCDVRLAVFDLRGKTLWRIMKKNRAPGSYQENVPSSMLPVGAYFLWLKAGGFVKAADASLVR